MQRYGVDGLTVATLMAGFFLIGLGLARVGGAIKFIPFPVVTGFTSAIAVISACSSCVTCWGSGWSPRRPR